MATHLASNPDIFEAAALVAAKDGIRVDTALARPHRAARTAGLSQEHMAGQLVASESHSPGLAV